MDFVVFVCVWLFAIPVLISVWESCRNVMLISVMIVLLGILSIAGMFAARFLGLETVWIALSLGLVCALATAALHVRRLTLECQSHAREVKTESSARVGMDSEELNNPPEVSSRALPDIGIRAKALSVAEIRAKHARAYEPWSAEEDANLRSGHRSGLESPELARLHKRQESAIRSRLAKLQLTT
ncbi:hypothetical protein AB4Y63_01625 [Leifsonia sp. YAF41]|uniref:hypothetical protein n=1 Tax=Leifsonia sp. YAF41 TaxID=3233086 RepID=UPI003F9C4B08